jgi:hypothetical protein
VALSRCRSLEGLQLAAPLQARAIINDERVDAYIARQEEEAQRSISQLPTLKEEYERYLLLQLFDFRAVVAQEESMVRLFAEFFYHSQSSLMQLHNQAQAGLRQRVVEVADKWRTLIQQMSIAQLHAPDFLERVQRSAGYFAETLNEVLGKPTDAADARRMLHLLSGRTHHVVTGVCLTTAFRQRSFSVRTEVTFKQLSDEEISYYVENYKPFDKAGAYGIQEWIGYIGVTGINGSYFNVMGLPVQRIYEELKQSF